MTMTEQITEVETRILDGLTSIHEQLIEANVQAAERIHELSIPAPDVDVAIEPAEAVANYYDFAGKILEANRTFAEQLVAAWAPAKPAKKAATRSTTKAK